MHYLDTAATTAVHPEVTACIARALERAWANPSSLYRPGMETEQAMGKARATLAKALGCAPQEVIFTASGTEGNNLAVLGAARFRRGWGNHIVATGYEHPAVARPLEELANREDFRLTLVNPGPDGQVDPAELVDAVGPNTVLLAAMQVNNETGACLDVAALAAAAKQKNPRTVVHVDGVQGFLKQSLCLRDTQIDSYALSGHKFHAPKGVGALYLRRGLQLTPVLTGGGQEQDLRPGTENLPYILGLARAVELAQQEQAQTLYRVQALNSRLRAGLAGLEDVLLHSPQNSWPGILSFSLPGLRSEVLLHFLEERNVYVSSGSACSRGQPSHTLAAMGLPPKLITSALRASFDGENTEADIDALLAGLQLALEKLPRGRVGQGHKRAAAQGG